MKRRSTMKLIKDKTPLKAHCAAYREAQQAIAFVPTMGNLHNGHLRLVEAAKQKADKVIVSIFVNPRQFAPHEDYNTYPRTLEKDYETLSKLGGVDLVFAPSASAMYSADCDISIHLPRLETILCGASRPHFFSGVMVVLAKLFNLISPQFVFMGEKDFQQLVITRELVKALDFPIEIISVPTVREPDGLAMSSRNQYLSAKERELAPVLYNTLKRVAADVAASQVFSKKTVQQAKEALASLGIVVDYIEVRYASDLREIKEGEVVSRQWVVVGAAVIGKTRLIDNVLSG